MHYVLFYDVVELYAERRVAISLKTRCRGRNCDLSFEEIEIAAAA
jgi:hypothetical protein